MRRRQKFNSDEEGIKSKLLSDAKSNPAARENDPSMCHLRVKFPDDFILQGSFGATETTSKIYDFVSENLI
jgi:hypothetical protein